MIYLKILSSASKNKLDLEHLDLVITSNGLLQSNVILTQSQVTQLNRGESIIAPILDGIKRHSMQCPRGYRNNCPSLVNEHMQDVVNSLATTDPEAIRYYALKLRMKAIEIEEQLNRLDNGKEIYV